MLDSIDMLEAIGQDASLRYATAEALATDSSLEDAPEALKAAILSGARSELCSELGHRVMQATQVTQNPGKEDDDEDEDEDEDDDKGGSPLGHNGLKASNG